MALVLADRVLETSTSEGLGTFALAGAQTGYQTFSDGIGNGNTCYYTINGQTTEQWEVGIGTVSAGTLARTTLISSNTGSFINFVAGVKNVFVTQPASKSIYKDANGDAIPLGSASATQLDITAQGDLRLQDTTGGEYVAIQAPATLASSYTLTMPTDDGTAGQALVTDGSGVLSWSTAASGDVYGPASATDNAVARYDGTTGKIIQNSAVTIADDGATVIAANSTSNALRITQIGAGNALLVEDSANPDATPFVIDAIGTVLVGTTTAQTIDGITPAYQQLGGNNYAAMWLGRYSANSTANYLYLTKSRSATVGTNTIVNSGDDLGTIAFYGADGTNLIPAATILGEVDGTPGTNDMPGRLVFNTTADGSATSVERMRIDSAGRIGVGTSTLTGYGIRTAQNITGAVISQGIGLTANVQSDVTTSARGVWTNIGTQATAFTLSNLVHFYSQQGTIGVGSTVTNQYGFAADSGLTGATNNYGFHGGIAAATGRWNFYAAGTADNYFAGALGLGSTATAGSLPLNISYNLTGATSVTNVRAIPSILSDVTSSATIFKTQVFTQAAAFTLGSLIHYDATLASIGATSAIANQYGFNAAASLIGATNNFGFYSSIASGTGRYNFYAAGTAANVFAGTTSIGGLVGSESLRVTPVASSVNYLNVRGAVTTASPSITAEGSDTNIDLTLTPKGTGVLAFGTYTAGIIAQAGYISIKDAGGTTRRLLVG